MDIVTRFSGQSFMYPSLLFKLAVRIQEVTTTFATAPVEDMGWRVRLVAVPSLFFFFYPCKRLNGVVLMSK